MWLTNLLGKLGHVFHAESPSVNVSIRIRQTGYIKMAKYFKPEEVEGLDQKLVDMLDRMREEAGIPITITCGKRTPEDNARLATSVGDSAHLTGLAADLHCPDSVTRYKLIGAALKVGFRRIGAETKHVHVDLSAVLPQDVLFLGVSS